MHWRTVEIDGSGRTEMDGFRPQCAHGAPYARLHNERRGAVRRGSDPTPSPRCAGRDDRSVERAEKPVSALHDGCFDCLLVLEKEDACDGVAGAITAAGAGYRAA